MSENKKTRRIMKKTMKVIACEVIALSALLAVFPAQGATEHKTTSSTSTEATQPDNTKKNERDRDGRTLTPGDQSNTEADRKITQDIRREIVKNDSLTVAAKNVKIITADGKVTLRGPVNSESEKTQIAEVANRVAGASNVDNQLEVKTQNQNETSNNNK
jgi:hyperosmotically inducible protein